MYLFCPHLWQLCAHINIQYNPFLRCEETELWGVLFIVGVFFLFHVVSQGSVFVKCTGIYSSIIWLAVVVFFSSQEFYFLISVNGSETLTQRKVLSSLKSPVLHSKSVEDN